MIHRWRDCLLGDVITFQRGFDITKKEQRPGPVAVISSAGPSSTHDEAKVQGPGVIIGRKGTLGTVHYSDRPFWPHDTTLWVKDFQGSDPRFVYYFLQTLGLGKYDVGASNPTLNRNHLHLLPVRVPDEVSQRSIAAVLTSYDDLIENNTRRIGILEEMARAIYWEWFVDFRYPGHEDVPLVDSDLGPVPERWMVSALDQVAAVNERSLKAGADVDDILYLDISSVGTGKVGDPLPVAFADAPGRARRLVADGDVIWSTVRPNRRSYAQIFDPPERLVVSTGLAVLTPRQVPPSYLYQATTTDNFVAYLVGRATGSAYPAVTGKVFEQAPVLLPPAELLNRFDEAVDPMDRMRATLGLANRRLQAARDLLLPRLISGEVDLSGLDLDGRNLVA